MLLKFGLVFLYHIFTDELSPLHSSFVDDDLMVFAQLYFIVLDSFIEGFIFVPSLLDVVDYLQEVDGH